MGKLKTEYKKLEAIYGKPEHKDGLFVFEAEHERLNGGFAWLDIIVTSRRNVFKVCNVFSDYGIEQNNVIVQEFIKCFNLKNKG